MPTTTYRLTSFFPNLNVYTFIWVDVVILLILLWMDDHPFNWSIYSPYVIFLFLLGVIWIGLYVTQSPCTLELDDQGFTITKHRRFNVLPKGPVREKWADFSYQSGAVYERSQRGYVLTIHLNNRKSYAFLTGIRLEEAEMMGNLHRDIEKRVETFRKMATVA